MRVAPDSPLRLSSAEAFSKPVDYFVSLAALRTDLSMALLSWFETEAPWKLVETDFYEQYEFSLSDVEVPWPFLVLREPGFLSQLKTKLEHLFHVEFGNDVDIAAHKLIRGQRIRLPN